MFLRKILNKIDSLNIKYKLFLITSSLLIGLSIIIYCLLYFFLPKFYENYKLDVFKVMTSDIQMQASELEIEDFIAYIHYLSSNENIKINLYTSNGNIVYGRPTPSFNKKIFSIFEEKKPNNYESKLNVTLKNSSVNYIVDLTMPLQPINEASIVFSKLMPYIIILALFISFIGAYIYSTYITKPLLTIIDMEREQDLKRKQFIATISHELKTPITIISGLLEGMIYNIGKYQNRDLYLQKTYESTNDLKGLVNEMLEISKADMTRETLELSNFNIDSLIETLVDKQSFLIENKKLHLHKSLKSNKVIHGDKNKIAKALNNIINNAIKYSPESENIFINTKNNNLHTIIEVKNTGVGIAKKDIDKLFDVFFRVEQSRSRKTGGSGLGLYISSQILKAHNFKYEVKSENNSVSFLIKI